MSPTARCVLLLPLLVAGLACAGATQSPCQRCDAGHPDVAADGPGDGWTMEAGSPGEAASEVVFSPHDASAEGPSVTRDTPPGEAARLRPISDAGFLFDDDFETGKATGWEMRAGAGRDASIGAWSVILGTSGSVLSQGVLDPNTWYIAFAKAAIGPDQIVEVRLRVTDFYAAAPSSAAAVFARYDPATDSGYFLALRGDGAALIRKRDHGVSASFGGAAPAGVRAGIWYTVRVEVQGSSISAFIDGVPVYGVTDDVPLAGGGIALGTIGATIEVDRVSAAAL